MEYLFEAQHYETLFRIKDKSSVLISELLLSGPLSRGGATAIQYDGFWSLVIDKRKKGAMKKIGLGLLGNSSEFNRYVTEFTVLMSVLADEVVPKYNLSITNLSKGEFAGLISNLEAFWRLYGYTEFVFHDFAVEESGSLLIKANLDRLGKIKMEARKMWNDLAVNGVILHLLNYFSSQYFAGGDEPKYLTIAELSSLFDGGRTSSESIAERRKRYVLEAKEDSYGFLHPEEAKAVVDKFVENEAREIAEAAIELKGVTANKGFAAGKVVIAPMLDLDAARAALAEMQHGDILVAQSTDPNLIGFCQKAAAIVTNQGGMLSHAAIISREFGIPCIVGAVYATKVLKNGDLVEVDADKGVVRLIK